MGTIGSKASASIAASSFMRHLPVGALLTANVHDNDSNSSTGEVRCTEESTSPKRGLASHQHYILLLLHQSYKQR